MYGLRDMFDLVKLVNKTFKAKFRPDLVHTILPFFKKIWPQIYIMKKSFKVNKLVLAEE